MEGGPAAEPAADRRDDLIEGQAVRAAEQGTVAHLQAAHAVAGGVGDHLKGDAFERLRCLQDGHGQGEPPEVVLEVPRVIDTKGPADGAGVGSGEVHPGRPGEIEQGLRSQ